MGLSPALQASSCVASCNGVATGLQRAFLGAALQAVACFGLATRFCNARPGMGRLRAAQQALQSALQWPLQDATRCNGHGNTLARALRAQCSTVGRALKYYAGKVEEEKEINKEKEDATRQRIFFFFFRCKGKYCTPMEVPAA